MNLEKVRRYFRPETVTVLCSAGLAVSTITEKWHYHPGRNTEPVWLWAHDRGLAIQTLCVLAVAILAMLWSGRNETLDFLGTLAVILTSWPLTLEALPLPPFTDPGRFGNWIVFILGASLVLTLLRYGLRYLRYGLRYLRCVAQRHGFLPVVYFLGLLIASYNCGNPAMDFGRGVARSLTSLSNGLIPVALVIAGISMALAVSEQDHFRARDANGMAAVCAAIPFLLSAKEWLLPASYENSLTRLNAGKYTLFSTGLMAAIAIGLWAIRGRDRNRASS
jgi:hypothetical protein